MLNQTEDNRAGNESAAPAADESSRRRGPEGSYSETAIVAVLGERIEAGVYVPGARLPSERDLAAEFGVSRSIIRSAISKLVEQGVVEQSHYRRPFVSFSNTRLKLAPSPDRAPAIALQTIAAVLPSDPIFPGGLSIVAGIHKILAETESPYRLTFLDTYDKDRIEVLRRETNAIETALRDGVSGLIWWSYITDDVVADVVRRYPDVPIVFIDRRPHNIDCDFVGLDDIDSSRMAVEHLIDQGHKRIAHLMDPGEYSTIEERARGYREALLGRGIPIDDNLIFHLDWSDDAERVTNTDEAFRHLWSQPNPPTALFASNDYIAHRFIKVARANGVRVPEDLSVIGHGNMERYTPMDAFLTTVDQPFETIGRSAARLILKRLQSNSGPSRSFQQVILPANLIVRGSALPHA
jgi:DNA-binding LacI/PurR family transcriptional regulator